MTLLRYWPHLLAAALIGWIAYGLGSASGDRRAAKAELALSYMERDAAQQVALAQGQARQAERRAVERIAEIDAIYASEIGRIESEIETRTADLLAGNLRLRHEIAALHTANLSREAAASGQPNDAAQRGAALIAAAIGIGAQCDAVQAGLIQADGVGR